MIIIDVLGDNCEISTTIIQEEKFEQKHEFFEELALQLQIIEPTSDRIPFPFIPAE